MSFLAAFDALPDDAFSIRWNGRLWRGVKIRRADGRAESLEAHEAGGRGYVSANVYHLSDGDWRLKPCEMPDWHVRAFVLEGRVVSDTEKGPPPKSRP